MSFALGEIAGGLAQSQMELAASYRDEAARLASAYRQLAEPTRTAIERVAATAETVEDFERLIALEDLQARMAAGLDDFEWQLVTSGERLQESAVRSALGYAETSAGAVVGWSTPNAAAVARLVNYMDNPALREAIGNWAGYHAEQVASLAMAGIAQGWNPRKTARAMMAYVENLPLVDAERMMRTVQVYSYRDAVIEGWRENSGVVRGWWWRADLGSARTCMACVALHGTEHGLNETLNDHHRGRCVPVPIVAGRETPGEAAGAAYFAGLDEATQIERMGRARWLAWRDGAFEFGQLVTTYEDAVYGEMRTQASLTGIVGAARAAAYTAEARRRRPHP